jgi:hypothetical protein
MWQRHRDTTLPSFLCSLTAKGGFVFEDDFDATSSTCFRRSIRSFCLPCVNKLLSGKGGDLQFSPGRGYFLRPIAEPAAVQQRTAPAPEQQEQPQAQPRRHSLPLLWSWCVMRPMPGRPLHLRLGLAVVGWLSPSPSRRAVYLHGSTESTRYPVPQGTVDLQWHGMCFTYPRPMPANIRGQTQRNCVDARWVEDPGR